MTSSDEMNAWMNAPRDYAWSLVFESNRASEEQMIIGLLKYMSHDDVRDCMHANEWSPDEEEKEEEDE